MEIEATGEEYRAPKTHAQLKRLVEEHLSLTKENAEQAKIDREYFDSKQLTGAQRQMLRERGQPELVSNKIGPIIRGMMGLLDGAATDPEAMPRSPRSRDAADIVTKLLRYVADKADFPTIKQDCSSNFLIEGPCAAITGWDGRNVTVETIKWAEFIYDPVSTRHDFKDAGFLGVGKFIKVDVVRELYPHFDGATDFGSFNDEKSKAHRWVGEGKDSVRIVDLYYRAGGDWHRAVFSGSQILHEGKSDHINDEGETYCPIEATSYEVSGEGDRYGAVRDMRSLQDSYNARQSRMLHLTNHRQVRQLAPDAPKANAAIAKREAAKPDGAIPYGWEPVPTPDMAQGQMLLLERNIADLDRLGPTNMAKAQGANTSGRARQILQAAGMAEHARAFGRFESFEKRLYRNMWFEARQNFTAEMTIRISDDPRALDFLTINEPVIGPVRKPVMDPTTQQPVIDAFTGQPAFEVGMGVVSVNNRLAELDVDISLTTVPDTVTLQQETFQWILEYATGLKMSPLDPAFEVVLELSGMPGVRDTIEKLQAMREQLGANQPDPMQAMAAEVGLDAQKADAELTRAKAFKAMSDAQATQESMGRRSMGLPD